VTATAFPFGRKSRPSPGDCTGWAKLRGFAEDSSLEETGFEPVWGFSCQVVIFGLLPVLCSELEKPFFVLSPAIRFAERAEGVKGPKR
jgi:hypothetical protein